MEDVITAGGLAMLILEGIKWIVRKIKKDAAFDFPTSFYTVSIPVLNALTPFVLFWLGVRVESPVLTMGWMDLIKYLVLIVLGSLMSLVSYSAGVKPLKVYTEEREALG